MNKLTVAVAIFFWGCLSAQAEDKPDLSVQGLYQSCKENNPNVADRATCIGFVSGASEIMMAVGSHDPVLGMCPSEPIPTFGARLQVFLNWAEKHPEQWSKPGSLGVLLALRETWPCFGKSN